MNDHPTQVTIPAGMVVRQYEQTASRDHDVELVPGTYDVHPVRSPEGSLTAIRASIPAIAKPHVASTVEFGGVALASEQRGGERETWGLYLYPWTVERFAQRTGAVFAP